MTEDIFNNISCSSLPSDLFIPGVERLHLVTVHIELPVTYEVLLVEESPIRTEEAVLHEVACTIPSTQMVSLAVCFLVSIVTFHLAHTGE